MEDSFGVVFGGAPVLVRLDGSDVGRLSFHEILNQGTSRALEKTALQLVRKATSEFTERHRFTNLDLITSSGRPLLAVRIRPFAEQVRQKLVPAARDQVKEVLDQRILVLIRHASHVIHDVSGIVLHEELVSSGFEMGMG